MTFYNFFFFFFSSSSSSDGLAKDGRPLAVVQCHQRFGGRHQLRITTIFWKRRSKAFSRPFRCHHHHHLLLFSSIFLFTTTTTSRRRPEPVFLALSRAKGGKDEATGDVEDCRLKLTDHLTSKHIFNRQNLPNRK